MERDFLLEEIKEALQREDPLTFEMKLEDLNEWDSLAVLSILTLYDELFGVIVNQDDIEKCITVSDLIDVVILDQK